MARFSDVRNFLSEIILDIRNDSLIPQKYHKTLSAVRKLALKTYLQFHSFTTVLLFVVKSLDSTGILYND